VRKEKEKGNCFQRKRYTFSNQRDKVGIRTMKKVEHWAGNVSNELDILVRLVILIELMRKLKYMVKWEKESERKGQIGVSKLIYV